MAKASLHLIRALRRAAKELKSGSSYMWGHMGSCNCGHLAQQITQLSRAEIHAYAMRGCGDWSDQVMDFCPTSGMPMDLLISQMLEAGLTTEDLAHLEKLSAPEILQRLPVGERHLQHNKRDDVVKYLGTWAQLLEEQLVDQVEIGGLFSPAPKESVVAG